MIVRVINLEVSSLVFLMLKLFIIIYKGYMFFRNSEKDDEESNSENSKDKLPEQNDNSEDGEESAVKYDKSRIGVFLFLKNICVRLPIFANNYFILHGKLNFCPKPLDLIMMAINSFMTEVSIK